MNQTKPVTEVVAGDVIRCAALGPRRRIVTMVWDVDFPTPAVAIRHSNNIDYKGRVTYVPIDEQVEVVQ
jgi:hypothetical protein